MPMNHDVHVGGCVSFVINVGDSYKHICCFVYLHLYNPVTGRIIGVCPCELVHAEDCNWLWRVI